MIIREADLEKDALAIYDGAYDFASRTVINLPSGDDFLNHVCKLITIPGFRILVAEENNAIIGGIGYLYAPYVWNNSITVGEKSFIWVKENAPFRTAWNVANAAIKEIIKNGAVPMFRTNSKGMIKLCERHGMQSADNLLTMPSMMGGENVS